MKVLTIDIKTKSAVSLRDVGIFAYAGHKTTMPVGIALQEDDNSPEIWLPPDLRTSQCAPLTDAELCDVIRRADLIQAFDMTMEYALWKYMLRRIYPWFPPVPEAKLLCISARAAKMGLPSSMHMLGREFSLPVDEAYSMTKHLHSATSFRKGAGKAVSGLADRFKSALSMETQVAQSLPGLPEAEQRLWRSGLAMNDRGIGIDVSRLRQSQKQVVVKRRAMIDEFVALTGIRNPMDGQLLLAYFKQQNIPVKSLHTDDLRNFAAQMPAGREKRVVELRWLIGLQHQQMSAMASNLLQADSRIRGLFIYHHTPAGEWGIRHLSKMTDLPRFFLPSVGCKFRVCLGENLAQNVHSWLISGNGIAPGAFACGLLKCCKHAVSRPGVTEKFGRLRIACMETFLKVMLPSGRDLFFYAPQTDQDGILSFADGYARNCPRRLLTAGFLLQQVENGLARDIMAFVMENLALNRFMPVWAGADRIITEAPFDEHLDKVFQVLVQKKPQWAMGIQYQLNSETKK